MLPLLIKRTGRTPWPAAFDLLDKDFSELLERWPGNSEGATGAYPVDIHEDDQHIYVDAELPGFTKEQVQVSLEDGQLSITAQRQAEEGKGEKHLSERRYTRVARAFTLPNVVDENKVDARLSEGVLHLVLNKREEVKPKRIQVR